MRRHRPSCTVYVEKIIVNLLSQMQHSIQVRSCRPKLSINTGMCLIKYSGFCCVATTCMHGITESRDVH